MLKTYTAKYTRMSSGYMGQLIDWPEVITEGKSLDDCRELLQDALQEMIVAYRQQQERLLSEGCDIMARLHNSITPTQRSKALEVLKEYEADARILAAQKS